MGRHSKPSKTSVALKRAGATAAIAGVAVGAAGIAGAGTADAFPGQSGIIKCESGGNPAAVNNTAAGQRAGRPAGLFQIVTGTWLANGGGAFAPTADRAAPWQQQIVADRIFAKQGTAPWECKAGSGPAQFASFAQTGKAATLLPLAPAPGPAKAPPVTTTVPNSKPTGSYTVVAGDTLSGIARKLNVPGGWAQLQKLNSPHVQNPNLIFVGEKIVTR